MDIGKKTMISAYSLIQSMGAVNICYFYCKSFTCCETVVILYGKRESSHSRDLVFFPLR